MENIPTAYISKPLFNQDFVYKYNLQCVPSNSVVMYLLKSMCQIIFAIFIASTAISSCNSLALESKSKIENLKTTYPWINENLLTRALHQDFPKSSVSINSFELTLIPPPSINFKLKLIRAVVEFEVDNVERKTSFVIKTTEKQTIPTSEMTTIEQEIVNYQRIIPAVIKILQTIGEDEHFALR